MLRNELPGASERACCSKMGKVLLVTLNLWVTLASLVHGQLSTADKQALLDLHNRLRGEAGGADILQSVSVLSGIVMYVVL